jgi:ankyrin repeat protein
LHPEKLPKVEVVKLVMSGLEINAKADGVRVSGRRKLTLRKAATAGSLIVVCGLLSLGINIDGTNAKRETALLQAARAGRLDMVRLLLSRGADATLAAQIGETALHFLIAFEDAEISNAADILTDHGTMPCLFSMVLLGRSSAPAELNLVGSPSLKPC